MLVANDDIDLNLNTLPKRDHFLWDKVAIDTELFQMDHRRLHRETGFFAGGALCNEDTVYIYTDEELFVKALRIYQNALWIMHNAQFDLFHMRRWTTIPERSPDKFWDTMIWDRLLWNGYYPSFALDDLGRRYCNLHLGKSVRKEFEKADTMSPAMRRYLANDAYATYHSYKGQQAALDNHPVTGRLLDIWDKIEGPLIEIIPKFKGFMLDAKSWAAQAEKHEARMEALKNELPFNPASWQQVKEWVNKTLPVHISSTRAEVLEEIVSLHPYIRKILEYRKAQKLGRTYGKNFIKHFLEDDGRIYAHYWTIGAATGRMASADPNMQNIPADLDYRGCFIAPQGRALVVADYEQQESRILASESGDQRLLDIFEHGEDIHLEVARLIYDDSTITRKDSRRKHGKTINLGLSYGLTPWGVAEKTNLTVEESKRLVNSYFRQFPGVQSYMTHKRHLASRYEHVTTQLGRVTWVNPYSWRADNISINAPIQGGAADQLKLAIVILEDKCKRAGIEFPIVAVIHDEIVGEFAWNEREQGKKLIVEAMIEAGQEIYPAVPWKVNAHIGMTWASKKAEKDV